MTLAVGGNDDGFADDCTEVAAEARTPPAYSRGILKCRRGNDMDAHNPGQADGTTFP